MGLTSPTLATVLVAATVLLPVLLVWGPVRLGRRTATWSATAWRLGVRPAPRRWWGAVGRWLGMVLAQLVCVATCFVLVNDWLRFYPTWGDLVGRPTEVRVVDNGAVAEGPRNDPGAAPQRPAQPATARTASGATLVTLPVEGRASGARGAVLVWLPPGYDDALAGRELPVLYYLPGQPGSPEGLYGQYDFDRVAAASIADGRTRPFIAVFPPIMVDPPRNTECLDQPGGPQTATWLVEDVRRAVSDRFRAAHDPAAWNVAGYSTGGYCAAMLLFTHRDRFGAAAVVGGYFHAWSDATTGDLFGGDAGRQRAASVLERLRTEQPVPTKMLIISSRGDPGSWGGKNDQGDSEQAIAAARRWPGTASIVLDRGGHGYRTYLSSFPEALAWLGRANGL